MCFYTILLQPLFPDAIIHPFFLARHVSLFHSFLSSSSCSFRPYFLIYFFISFLIPIQTFFSIPYSFLFRFAPVLRPLCTSSSHSFFLYKFPFEIIIIVLYVCSFCPSLRLYLFILILFSKHIPFSVPYVFLTHVPYFPTYFFISFFLYIQTSFSIPPHFLSLFPPLLLSLCTSSSHSFFPYKISSPFLICFFLSFLLSFSHSVFLHPIYSFYTDFLFHS